MLGNAELLLFLLLVVVIAKLSTYLSHIGQPALLGELVCGVLFALLGFYHIGFFHALPENKTLAFLSELGSIFLLFEIGLESDITIFKNNRSYAILIALLGAVFPFVAGYVFIVYFVANIDSSACLFIAAALAATSTGISVSIFKEYKFTNSKACQIVLAASVIDDIISLLVLTGVTAVVTTGGIELHQVGFMAAKIIAFFILLYAVIVHLLPRIVAANPHRSRAGDLTITMVTCLCAAWLAHTVGVSSIIGAFLAGLFINKELFHEKSHLVYPFVWIFVPVFFVYSGMQIDINSFLDSNALTLALFLSVIAIVTKVIPPLLIPQKIGMLNKLAVGVGMVPRGEIGLIIALIGKEVGVLSDYYFNVIALVVIITSVVAPVLLGLVIKHIKQQPHTV